MNQQVEPLFKDEFVGEPPTKRALAYIQSRRELGNKVAGVYCGYAPLELLHAMNLVPAVLCAFANGPIETAETVLPANLCPLIKSSFGFIMKDTCPFFALSDAVIAETTCDGKKKMFELIADRKPMFVMDLPQLPDEKEALENWTVIIRKLQSFLEKTFGTKADDAAIENAIRENNRKNRMVMKALSYAALPVPVMSWKEMHDVIFYATPAPGRDLVPVLDGVVAKLEERRKRGFRHGGEQSPRVLITGSPVGGDATKVFKIVEDAGGVIVAIDSCVGMKQFSDTVAEGTGDPARALAERYLRIPCACMTPNTGRLATLDRLIDECRPDAVIDVVLQACHGYNIESTKVGEHVRKKRGLSFLKIVTDYSQGDVEQIKTRVEGLFESI